MSIMVCAWPARAEEPPLEHRAHHHGLLVEVGTHLYELGDDLGRVLPCGEVERGPPVLSNAETERAQHELVARCAGAGAAGRTLAAPFSAPLPRPTLTKYSSHLPFFASLSGCSAAAEEVAPMGASCGQGVWVGSQSWLPMPGRPARSQRLARCTDASPRATGNPWRDAGGHAGVGQRSTASRSKRWSGNGRTCRACELGCDRHRPTRVNSSRSAAKPRRRAEEFRNSGVNFISSFRNR